MLPLILLLSHFLNPAQSSVTPTDVQDPIVFYTGAKDCGSADKFITFVSSSITPDPIIYPGSVNILSNLQITKDVPAEKLMMKLNLQKLEPRRMTVPCLQGIGSCTYDVCNDVIPNHQEQFCALGACKCPLVKGSYKPSKPIPFKIPNKGGSIFKKLLNGYYDGNITFFHDGTKKEYGCLNMKFNIKVQD